MKQFFGKPTNIFFTLFVFLLLLFFLFPINLFDGEIVLQKGIQKEVVKAPLSLSYFIGIGYNEKDMEDVKDFYLLPQGYLMAFIFIVCIPAMAAYRVYLGKTKMKVK